MKNFPALPVIAQEHESGGFYASLRNLEAVGKHRKPVMLITGQGRGNSLEKRGKFRTCSQITEVLVDWMKIPCFTKLVKPGLHAILVKRAVFSENYRLNLVVNNYELGHSSQ
ncbi:MAG: hypothetical protein CM1200mP30_19290 [Pseudomonadota bacterium]|nr:MAG: hypothetical protein CM1200mP30_19290 [Pseudomonadota bacterium]